ncbi:amino acid adenylation protein [Actinoplanes awajinensis subsp. mycoplanecinus]|uniref:Amino acid adenylation protein n=2 Tax=Actinoplanes awajinensis TaxID=135946 RepID=A0A101JFM5_9ACTN|nr:amino acid adenylation protein [Actinoplanes awajinensis subsp. mycoplanecinus]
MIVALLGILRTGAAYIPLDPEYPEARLRLILADTAPGLLLTERHLAPLFPGYQGELLFLDDLEPDDLDADDLQPGSLAADHLAADEPAAMPADVHPEPVTTAVRGSDLAYIVHTSGSTGRPKGVMISHASLANHAFAVNELFGFGPGDRVLLCRSLSFDASVEEIFPPLLNGATLIVAGDPLRQTFRALTQQLVTTRTTFLSVPTAFWHSWVRESDCLVRLSGESSLRLMIVAGERAQRGALSIWKKHAGDRIRWCNVYGPTEGTVTSTVYEPAPGWETEDFSTVPIGYPIGNVQAHVLGEDMSPVPAGSAGELYIGGAGVAAGYLNEPELTSRRFVPDPFSAEPGARLYRTGDLVRRGPADCLEFLGRGDDQVKVRGYRIEPGEVESVASAHPSVRACAVVDRVDDLGEMRLACFVVADPSAAPAADDLRSHLRRELPWYMIPSSITVLPSLPMTPNRKIDRAALRVLPVTEPLRQHVAPRTTTEKALAQIWEETLQQKDISVVDDFFDIGGHSLVAATIISRVRSTLGLDLPVREFFAAPTIEGLAGVVARRQAMRQAAAQ